MADEANNTAATEGDPPESGDAIRTYLRMLPKEEQVTYLEILSLIVEERDKLAEAEKALFVDAVRRCVHDLPTMCEAETVSIINQAKADGEAYQRLSDLDKKAYWFEWDCRRDAEQSSEAERESLEVGMAEFREWYAGLTEAQKREHWEREEKGEKMVTEMLDAVGPVMREFFDRWANTPASAIREPTDDERKAFRERFAALEQTYDEKHLRGAVGLFDLVFDIIRETVEPLRSHVRIDRHLRAMLGDSYLNPLPITIRGHLQARGIDTNPEDLSFRELADAVCRPEKESWYEQVLPTLDELFQHRFGWQPGAVRTKTITELCLALEHAAEHDDPAKPSIWKMT